MGVRVSVLISAKSDSEGYHQRKGVRVGTLTHFSMTMFSNSMENDCA